MRVKIKKKVPGTRWRKGVVATVSRAYGFELITQGYAERQDKTADGPQPDPQDIAKNIEEEE